MARRLLREEGLLVGGSAGHRGRRRAAGRAARRARGPVVALVARRLGPLLARSRGCRRSPATTARVRDRRPRCCCRRDRARTRRSSARGRRAAGRGRRCRCRRGERSLVEGVAAGAVGRREGDMHALGRLAVAEEEEGTAIAEADVARPVDHHREPQRCERCLVERTAAGEISHAYADMVKHHTPPRTSAAAGNGVANRTPTGFGGR